MSRNAGSTLEYWKVLKEKRDKEKKNFGTKDDVVLE